MLEASKSIFFERIFSVYNRHLLRRRFHSLRVSGLNFLVNKNLNLPLIIYCNHSSWWDGLVAFQISRETFLDSFVMMEEKQLKNLFFFRRLGAFSVVRENSRQAYRSIEYSARLLKEKPDRTLWIFPQGEILPNDLRPLKFYNGISKIIEKIGKCLTASLSMRYEFLGQYKPQIFVKIDEPETLKVDVNFSVNQCTDELTLRLTENLERLKKDVIYGNLSTYKSIL